LPLKGEGFWSASSFAAGAAISISVGSGRLIVIGVGGRSVCCSICLGGSSCMIGEFSSDSYWELSRSSESSSSSSSWSSSSSSWSCPSSWGFDSSSLEVSSASSCTSSSLCGGIGCGCGDDVGKVRGDRPTRADTARSPDCCTRRVVGENCSTMPDATVVSTTGGAEVRWSLLDSECELSVFVPYRGGAVM
jgi:hypothetical protein